MARADHHSLQKPADEIVRDPQLADRPSADYDPGTRNQDLQALEVPDQL